MVKKFLKDNRLLLSILVGVVLGITVGVSAHGVVQASTNPSSRRVAMYIKFPGELFIRMLTMISTPLITSSIIVALTDSEKSLAGQFGKQAMIYYVSTTVFASALGLGLGFAISPGSGVVEETTTAGETHRNSVDSFLDLLRNCFPDNIIQAMFHSTYTVYREVPESYRFLDKSTNTTSNMSAAKMSEYLKKNLVVPRNLRDAETGFTIITNDVTHDFKGVANGGGKNMIGLLLFSIALGIVLKMIGEEGRPLVAVFKSLWSATMKLVDIIMWLSPIGIGSIVAGNIVEAKGILVMFKAMGKFVLTSVVGHAILSCIFYPALYIFFTRRSPLQHIKNVLPALATAFGTASSAATLPTTIECCESRAKIDQRVTRFVLPVGDTCNMDGVSFFVALVVVFIDQMEPSMSLNFSNTILTIVMATLVSIGASGVPGPGLIAEVIVLETIGLPIDKMGPIFIVHWFNDRLLTMVNVMGDTYAAAIVERLSRAQLTEKNNEVVELREN